MKSIYFDNNATTPVDPLVCEAMVQELDEKCIAISAHAACETGTVEPSHVLRAMGIGEDYIYGSLRISLSRFNTIEEVEVFLDILPLIVQKSCQLFPM